MGSGGFEKVLIGTRGARETFLRGVSSHEKKIIIYLVFFCFFYYFINKSKKRSSEDMIEIVPRHCAWLKPDA